MPRKKLDIEKTIDNLVEEVKQTSHENDVNDLHDRIVSQVPFENQIKKIKRVNERKKDELGFQIIKPRSDKAVKRPYRKRKLRSKTQSTQHGASDPNDIVFREDAIQVSENIHAELLQLMESVSTPPLEVRDISTSWSNRRERKSQDWSKSRSFITNENITIHGDSPPLFCLTSGCTNSAQIRYRSFECSSARYLCSGCDINTHLLQPFHSREAWVPSMYKPVPSAMAVANEGDRILLVPAFSYVNCISNCCPKCNISLDPNPFCACVVITMSGRHDIYLPSYTCNCGFSSSPQMRDILFYNLWPASPAIKEGIILYDQQVLMTFANLKKESPGISVRAFIATLKTLSMEHGRNSYIDPVLFSDAMREWQYHDYELDRMRGINVMECPACSEGMHACHVDGNRKVYRYGYNRRCEELYYGDIFIAEDKEVDNFVQRTRNPNVKVSDNCGESHWKAAKSTSKSMASLDETGLCMACCRHTILYKAVNMHQGEIFAYPLFLHMGLLRTGMKYFCQDVICRYYPWLLKLSDTLPEVAPATTTKPFLSVMHAKAHDWPCQILYGGRLQDGAAMTTGEELELVNSNISRYGFTTKRMTKSSRHCALTNAALSWNKSKIMKLGTALAKRYSKMASEKNKADSRLANLQGECSVSDADISQFCSDVVHVAKNAKRKKESVLPEAAEYFLLKQQLNIVPQVEALENDIAANGLLAINMTKVKHIKNKRKRYQQLETRLTREKNAEDVQEEGRQILLSGQQLDLQNAIEETAAEIRQKNFDKYKLHDSSKQRMRLNKQMTRLRQRLHTQIGTYNRTAAATGCAVIEEGSNEQTIWPWIKAGTIGLKTKILFLQAKALCSRLNEEIALLQQEMKALLLHCGRCMEWDEPHQMLYISEKRAMTGSFHLPNSSDDGIIRGLLALRHEGHSFWTALRSTSAQQFNSVFDKHVPINVSESEYEDSPNDYESTDSEM